MTVTAATKWASNADMILDVVELGYIRPTDRVIDLTFGRGKWWTKYQHPGVFTANIDPDCPPNEMPSMPWICRDFRDLGDIDAYGPFDVVVFDPPYVSMGGRASSGLPDFMDRFGLENAATTPELLQQDNNRGLAEAYRICKPHGLVLAKCAPYISSGVRKEGDWWTRDAALELGFTVEDMLIHLGDVRAQPKVSTCRKCGGKPLPCPYDTDGDGDCWVCANGGAHPPCDRCHGKPPTERRQKHARNNYSVCFVLRKARPKRGKAST